MDINTEQEATQWMVEIELPVITIHVEANNESEAKELALDIFVEDYNRGQFADEAQVRVRKEQK
jgi:hypothetical protein